MTRAIIVKESQGEISKKKLRLLDVCEKIEYAMGRVPTTANLPLSEFVSGYQILGKDKVYHIICQSGSRSEQAAVSLPQQGHQAANVVGGISAWTGVLEY